MGSAWAQLSLMFRALQDGAVHGKPLGWDTAETMTDST